MKENRDFHKRFHKQFWLCHMFYRLCHQLLLYFCWSKTGLNNNVVFVQIAPFHFCHPPFVIPLLLCWITVFLVPLVEVFLVPLVEVGVIRSWEGERSGYSSPCCSCRCGKSRWRTRPWLSRSYSTGSLDNGSWCCRIPCCNWKSSNF